MIRFFTGKSDSGSGSRAAGIVTPLMSYRETHLVANLGWVDLDFGSSPGWWAATVATYCPNRMVEHPKSKSSQPRFSTRCDTLYFSGLNPVGQPRRLGEGGA